MTAPLTIRRAIRLWAAWRTRQKLRRAIPVLSDLDAWEASQRRRHKPVRAIHAARKAALHERLRKELAL